MSTAVGNLLLADQYIRYPNRTVIYKSQAKLKFSPCGSLPLTRVVGAHPSKQFKHLCTYV